MVNRWIKILFIIAVAALLVKSGVSAAVYLWPKTDIDATGSGAALELIRLTNDYRKNLGLNGLVVNPRLTQAAVSKAKDILAKQYFSHTSPSGKKFSDWVKEVNYAYFYVGENLAIDFNAPQEIFDAWLNSPKHKENIVRPEFQEIGIADLKGKYDGRETDVVVQLFGSRVLGANELSATGNSALADNYFASAGNAMYDDYFGLVDNYLNYFLFLVVLLMILLIIIRKIQRKKTALAKKPTLESAVPLGVRVSAKKQAPALVSLYTKRTPTRNANSRTLKKT